MWLFKRGQFKSFFIKNHLPQCGLEEQQTKFKEVFTLISEKAGGNAFTRFNTEGDPVGRLAPAYYEAAVFAFSENKTKVAKLSPQEVIQRLQSAFSDPDFLSSTGPGANTIEKLNIRISVVSNFLSK